MEQETGLSESAAVIACAAMTLFYVAILYAPSLILRLPPPSSLKEFMIRREASHLLGVYGIRLDHIWQAVVFPISLTSLMYAGSFCLKSLLLVESWKENLNECGGFSFGYIKNLMQNFIAWMSSTSSNVLAWRNYVVAPLTEELVFRACMIPLLLCGGFKIYSVFFLCPILFSLAHLNHWMEIYVRHNYSMLKAAMVVGLQLGYTVIFGSYASFLFIRTGHLLAPLVAHIFCNFMDCLCFLQGVKVCIVVVMKEDVVMSSLSFVCISEHPCQEVRFRNPYLNPSKKKDEINMEIEVKVTLVGRFPLSYMTEIGITTTVGTTILHKKGKGSPSGVMIIYPAESVSAGICRIMGGTGAKIEIKNSVVGGIGF
ncbi:hypothetical protein GH714_030190 [Hevea brasiliensis]|uniref:intramembrane prenyl-peptidase Rce1 n=1 Tax=Hevea brasiliensis TaxID=3981 RepID=A0A6A6M5I7_HEVBR|nr:hypothetical protein GH714_030190 [Hevea brasiliensis]